VVSGKVTVNRMGERYGMVGSLVPRANAANDLGTHNVYYVKYYMTLGGLSGPLAQP